MSRYDMLFYARLAVTSMRDIFAAICRCRYCMLRCAIYCFYARFHAVFRYYALIFAIAVTLRYYASALRYDDYDV